MEKLTEPLIMVNVQLKFTIRRDKLLLIYGLLIKLYHFIDINFIILIVLGYKYDAFGEDELEKYKRKINETFLNLQIQS